MTEDLLDYWVRLIRPFFPDKAWIVSRYSGDDHVIEIDWKLDDDPLRPSRRSRKIQIVISDGAIEDYLDRDKKERESFEIGLKKLIHERYSHPAPNEPVRANSANSPDKLLIAKGTFIA